MKFIYVLVISFGLLTQFSAMAEEKKAKSSTQVAHQNYNEDECYKWNAWKYCVERKGTWSYVTAASGNRNYQFNYKAEYRYYKDDEKVHSGNYKGHYKSLAKKGKIHLIKSKYSSKTDRFGDHCFSYSYQGDYQYVKGKVVRKKYDYDFQPCKK